MSAASKMAHQPVSSVTCVVQGLTSDGAVEFDATNRVIFLRPGSGASDCGVRVGDRLMKIDGEVAPSPPELLGILSGSEQITIELERNLAGSSHASHRAQAAEEPPESPPHPMHEMEQVEVCSESSTEGVLKDEHRHRRRASAPAGFASLAARARASLSANETRRAAEGSKSPRSVLAGSRSDRAIFDRFKIWWDERVKKPSIASSGQPGSAKGAILPMPTFLEEAFDVDAQEDPIPTEAFEDIALA